MTNQQRQPPTDLLAYNWAESLSQGEQDVLLTSSLRRLQSMIDAALPRVSSSERRCGECGKDSLDSIHDADSGQVGEHHFVSAIKGVFPATGASSDLISRDAAMRAVCARCANPERYEPAQPIEGSKRLFHFQIADGWNAGQCDAQAIKELPGAATGAGEGDSPAGAAWREWFTCLGERATADVVNATATLVIEERRLLNEPIRNASTATPREPSTIAAREIVTAWLHQTSAGDQQRARIDIERRLRSIFAADGPDEK